MMALYKMDWILRTATKAFIFVTFLVSMYNDSLRMEKVRLHKIIFRNVCHACSSACMCSPTPPNSARGKYDRSVFEWDLSTF